MRLLYLVRHGQASFGKRDYDALSDLGHEQSRVLGRALAARGVVPDVVVRGELRRHRETAEGILDGLILGGLGGDLPIEVDAGWDEFDFQHVMEVHQPLDRSQSLVPAHGQTPAAQGRALFQEMFEAATERWTGGDADADYHESFPAFSVRVRSALERAAALQPERGTVLVVSSGGPIGLAASQILAGDASLWARLNRVAVNTGVTKVINGGRGLNLATYNDHSHVEHDRELLTYR